MTINKIQVSGVTLIELLIVVTIIAILSAIAFPSFQSSLQRQRILSVAEAVSSDFKWAKSEAIKRGTDVDVSFSNGQDGSWFYLIVDNSADCDVIKSVNYQGDAIEQSCLNNAQQKHFGTVGLSQNFSGNITSFDFVRGTAKAGTVTITDEDMTLQVRLSILGKSKICTEQQISGVKPC